MIRVVSYILCTKFNRLICAIQDFYWSARSAAVKVPNTVRRWSLLVTSQTGLPGPQPTGCRFYPCGCGEASRR